MPVLPAGDSRSLAGLTWILSALTVALPDVTYFVNLLVFLLMWLSPIGFTPEMVPAEFRFVIYLNPVTYLISAYRTSMLGTALEARELAIYVAGCLLAFALGAAFFRAFKGVLVDYE